MSTYDLKNDPIAAARFAGFLYLSIAAFGGFSMGYLPTLIIAPGDAGATANNIAANMGLFRLGILFDVIVILCEIGLTVILYGLLKPVSRMLSQIAAIARFGMVIVMGLNLVNYLVPLVLLNGSDYLSVFSLPQREALALLFLEAHQYGVYVWGLFFGIHLSLLGYLVFKSGYFPKVLGGLLVVGGFGYTVEALQSFVVPGNGVISMLVVGLLTMAVIGELSFALWLVIKGLRMAAWEAMLRDGSRA